MASRPFDGWSPALALASGALALLAIWTLASAAWSDAPVRALTEFDRTLLYALVLVLTGSAVARVGDLAVLLRWTAAAFARRRARGPAHAARAGHVSHLRGVSARADRVPADLLERDGDRVRAVRAVRRAPQRERRASRAWSACSAAAALPMAARDAVPDVLARRDLGAARSGSCSTCCCAQPRGLLTAAIAAVPGGRRRVGRLRRRIVGACGLRHGRRGARSASRRVDARRVLRSPRRRCEPRCCGSTRRLERVTLPRAGAGRVRRRRARCVLVVGGARRGRAGEGSRRRRHVPRGPVLLGDRPARPADVGGRQRAHRQLARRAGRRSARSRCTAPAPGPTGSRGTASARTR